MQDRRLTSLVAVVLLEDGTHSSFDGPVRCVGNQMARWRVMDGGGACELVVRWMQVHGKTLARETTRYGGGSEGGGWWVVGVRSRGEVPYTSYNSQHVAQLLE